MTDPVKANRAVVVVGSTTIDGFRLPDGAYLMSQAQAAETIEEPPVYALRFLASKDSKALLGEDYTDYTPESIEIQSEPGKRGQTRINALPLNVVTAYWLYRAYRGNKKAFLLCWSLLTESLERRFDNAFGVIRTEQERNEQLQKHVQRLQFDLSSLGEAFSMNDIVKQERDYFERLLNENGINPWDLPDGNQQKLD